MSNLPARLQHRLDRRRRAGARRQLWDQPSAIDFCSNDYLGLAHDERVYRRFTELWGEGLQPMGATGSRLMSGNYALIEKLEADIARFHGAEAGLLYSSGYGANLGLFSCIADRHDTIIFDARCHASIRDGIRLSQARHFSFEHNSLLDLEQKLVRSRTPPVVVIESLYSMDGDRAPLEQIAELCARFDAALIVDDAHALGVCGAEGRGLVFSSPARERVYATVITFGKALGAAGGMILGPALLREYLINFSRPFIYSTGVAPQQVLSIRAGYETMRRAAPERSRLEQLAAYFARRAAEIWGEGYSPSGSHIERIIIGGNARTRAAAERCRAHGIEVRAVLSPTVPEGTERLRISLHAFNTREEIDRLLDLVREYGA